MAKTYFQQLGKWFPRGGKTAVFSLACEQDAQCIDELSEFPLFLFATANLRDGDGTCEVLNDYDYYPDDGHLFLVKRISYDEEPNNLCDIMEGYSFYLTDNENGSQPSEDMATYGCFVTWSD